MVSGVNGIVVYRPSIDGYRIILQESIHRPPSTVHHRRCSLFSKRDYLEIDEESKIVMTSWIEDLRLFGQNRKRRKGDEKRIQNDFQAQAKTQRIAT